jgi:RNA polymerase sigma-70 factor (ECF subfamily)
MHSVPCSCCALEEMTVEETATRLDIPEATVRTRYFRARGLLREALSREIDYAFEEAFSFDGARCDRIVAAALARLAGASAGNAGINEGPQRFQE